MCVLKQLGESNGPLKLQVIFTPINHNNLIKSQEVCVRVCLYNLTFFTWIGENLYYEIKAIAFAHIHMKCQCSQFNTQV